VTPQLCVVRDGARHWLPHDQQQLHARVHGSDPLWHLSTAFGDIKLLVRLETGKPLTGNLCYAFGGTENWATIDRKLVSCFW
jgi:hypothetical protein